MWPDNIAHDSPSTSLDAIFEPWTWHMLAEYALVWWDQAHSRLLPLESLFGDKIEVYRAIVVCEKTNVIHLFEFDFRLAGHE